MEEVRPNKYRSTLTGSIGAGLKSVMGSKGRRFYILEHKVASRYHDIGDEQRIIVDEIELGRDASCQVRFDESFSTVSRKHAAIVRDGNGWKLIPLSTTNSTLLNGIRLTSPWYLQNGDEIQLSNGGPKLGFIVPQGDKGLVKSIGMTARLGLFRQQALRPYKTAIAIICTVLVLLLGAGAYYMGDLYVRNRKQAELIAANEATFHREIAARDSLLAATKTQSDVIQTDVKNLSKQFKATGLKVQPVPIRVKSGNINNAAINNVEPGVYYIRSVSIAVTTPDGETGTLDCRDENVPSWSGTGFLLEDGTFITARHVIEAWYYWMDGSGSDSDLLELNYVVNNGGKVRANFIAVSSSGDRILLNSDMFHTNRRGDRKVEEDGTVITLAQPDDNDYAYTSTSHKGSLKASGALSKSLERGEKMTILGFPLGLGANSLTDITPVYGSAIVSVNGLQQGMILTTDTNYERGNSGGPALVEKDGELIVVGIVSAIAGRNTGFVVPISKILK